MLCERPAARWRDGGLDVRRLAEVAAFLLEIEDGGDHAGEIVDNRDIGNLVSLFDEFAHLQLAGMVQDVGPPLPRTYEGGFRFVLRGRGRSRRCRRLRVIDLVPGLVAARTQIRQGILFPGNMGRDQRLERGARRRHGIMDILPHEKPRPDRRERQVLLLRVEHGHVGVIADVPGSALETRAFAAHKGVAPAQAADFRTRGGTGADEDQGDEDGR